MSLSASQNRAGLALIAPASVLALLFLFAPLSSIFVLAFTDYQLGDRSLSFVGFENFEALADDPTFWKSLSNTLIYSAVVVPGSMLLGLVSALLIDAGTSLRSFYRTAFFLPVMASLLAMAVVWEFMLHPSFGIVNATMKALGFAPHNWLKDGGIALYVLAVIGIWQSFGFNMVLFMAGLSAIPRDLYDAAEMDGTPNAWARFKLITWPLLAPVTVFVAVTSVIRSFQVFDTVHALTQGGPNKATEVLLYTIYAEGFEFFRSGHAAAITIVFILLVVGVSLLRFVSLKKNGASA
ncbi:ABC transporter permease [Xaviernesmea oryzae]|uniref:ABC transporter permease n=1 Tax=Xaviernesmea oryzae TaxID=464029 RepID=A0A1Q9AWE0_9HYPH|nr:MULTISPECIES: sugar ABC transporter permease [Rhizobium/Agrobacterium group]MBW9060429.1 sugar ABC transporter permease [Agrobacterium pusense]OLP59740.1 ABC transporter permease [Xaviernesmea oryzae]SEM09669.1 carbohydrate ABC transporter membrane protein 1, CUT1 family (TC 3.A.1.1.-) [Xaviernesmea oryzae]